MRLLCDQHVASKYVETFERSPGVTVRTVREVLSPAATDAEIADLAARRGWVVFTNDDDFFYPNVSHGLIVYSQTENPNPGIVVDAIREIDEVYHSTEDIVEYVPNGWV